MDTIPEPTKLSFKQVLILPTVIIPIAILLISSTLPFINLCGSPCGFTCCGDYEALNIFVYAARGTEEGAGPFILIHLLLSLLVIVAVLASQGRIKAIKIGYTLVSVIHLILAGLLLLAALLGRPTIGHILAVLLLGLQVIVSFFPPAWQPLAATRPA